MKNLLKAIFGDESEKKLKEMRTIVERINSLEESTKALSDEECKAKTLEFKTRLAAGETLEDILPEAFALVREASRRTLGQRHYDVQLIGGIVLHRGMIAEMRTGEGKTLVATLPAYLNALEGKGVHVITVNDYLARRDAQWMSQIHAFLGLSVGIINDANQSYLYDPSHASVDEARDEQGSFRVFYEFLRPCSKKQAYDADITYGTNSQFGFDFLRDNTERNPANVVQRGQHYTIIDEVDSILIDEARVPLILSAQSATPANLYQSCMSIAKMMDENTDYEVDEKMRAVSLKETGITKAERALGIENLYTPGTIMMVHHIETAVRARALFLRDRDYVVRDGNVLIVDPFTGRIQDGRRYSDGLHQALEAKEGVTIQNESRTVASITYQNYFKLYKKYAGMTGTAKTSEEEFYKVYSLEVITIPTHREIARRDHMDIILQTEQGKFRAVARKVKELNERGQPVLIGTISIEKNELLSAYLLEAGVPHEVLNAKNHEHEGEIIAQSGRKGSVVIATNMAGRGVDIKLGGNPSTDEEGQEVKALGGLFVLGTERHDARRIDNQLRGRAGRQGDPGETQFYVSLEDPLMKIFGGDSVKNMIGKLGIAPDEPITNSFISRSLEQAQAKIEGFNFDSRKHVLQYDDVMSYHRNLVYARRKKILAVEPQAIEELLNDVANATPAIIDVITEKRSALGEQTFLRAFSNVALQTIDLLWMEHLEVMDATRQSVNLRAYGQREPLVEYKRESLRLFKEMERILYEKLALFIEAMETNPVAIEAEPVPVMVSLDQTLGRNDKVTMERDGEQLEVKVKKVEQYLKDGWKVVKP